MSKLKFELASDFGFPPEQCIPEIVTARVINVQSTFHKTRSLDRRDSFTVHQQDILFAFDINGKRFTAKEIFVTGQIVPDLGQYVRGIVVQNQAGSWHFVTTHLLKVKS